ncbi:MAG: FecCD family ABC transporter permease [Pseudonocardia sp.]
MTAGVAAPARGRLGACIVLLALITVTGVAALSLGTPTIAPTRLLEVLLGPDEVPALVLRELRIPRVALGLVAGAALGVAGLVLQEALRNPLAAPDLVGVSSGAVLAVAIVVVGQIPVGFGTLPAIALGGGLGGGLLTLAAARRARSPAAVLLIGAAVSAALQAAFFVVFALGGQLQAQLLFRFLLGSLSGVLVDDVLAVAPWLLLSIPAAVLAGPVLAVLRLGDEAAGALGVRVERARAAALAIAVVLVGPIIAVCGPVAWVGLLAPHLARRIRPSDDALGWLPLTALCGALVVVLADLVARLALAPIETPVGAWTAIAGVVGGLALARRHGFVR